MVIFLSKSCFERISREEPTNKKLIGKYRKAKYIMPIFDQTSPKTRTV
jgi:hypothetical protein